ncbi:MAG: hypothetical protein AAGG68_24575 [Bacteroidota bacterium]
MQQEELKTLLTQGRMDEVIQQLHQYFPKNSLGAYTLKNIHLELSEAEAIYIKDKNYLPLDKATSVVTDSLLKLIDRMELLQQPRREADVVSQEILDQHRKEIESLRVENQKMKKTTGFWMVVVFAIIVTVILLALLN